MALILKSILGLFIVIGIAITLYGLYQVLGSMTFVKNSPERARATFVGYHGKSSRQRAPVHHRAGQASMIIRSPTR